ncbi:MAG: tRNA dihydrouridine synthase DusB [Gammaproteobacteria bacterium]|nr:tRNA dihydrouridine synthase DusB [Gammaproteobacteria bacterium]
MKIGSHVLKNNLVLAPMAGVTDKPFRQLCRELGAGLLVSEMITSNPSLFSSRKTRQRLDHSNEAAPVVVQIAGADPIMMANAAVFNVEHGADIIDINMGCPAKKVCNVMAGSALMQDEALVTKILEAVVAAVDVPVTLKIRSGWNDENKNAKTIALIAEKCGIQALSIHGRTRASSFKGKAEHDTAKAVKASVSIPIIANGDINSPEEAARVLKYSGADAIMIGRAAQGRPWIFREIAHYLETGEHLPAPDNLEVADILSGHLRSLYDFYGEYLGVRIARKHIGWYCREQHKAKTMLGLVNQTEDCSRQLKIVETYFQEQEQRKIAA